MISPNLCLKCKGRLLCGLPNCPILEKFYSTQKISRKIGTEFQGTNPNSMFVSWHNYPEVSIAPMTASECLDSVLAEKIDNDQKWFGMPVQSILDFRQQLIRSTQRIKVDSASNPSYDLMELQEVILARKPVDLAVELKKVPAPKLEFNEFFAPMGPSAPQKSIQLQENPSIDRKLDYLANDVDVKASAALTELFDYGIEANKLIKVFSAGLLGVKKNRVFVPTRWSITAVDDTLSKHLIKGIKSFQQLSSIKLFSSNYLDNLFFVLLVPGEWSFEMLESWIPGSVWYPKADSASINVIQDYESFKGRKNYASNITGAYYSARLATAEYLDKIKRQASCVVFREINPGYSIPLGVWQIRENVRHAFKQKPLEFQDLSLALKFIEKKLSVPFNKYLHASKLLDQKQNQKKLFEFSLS